METKFCPDCGEACSPDFEACPECGFPMKLELVSTGTALMVPKSQVSAWNRISQLLRKNGLAVKIKPASSLNAVHAWWLLPGLGLAVFLASLMFGPQLVDAIWSPPRGYQETMRLGGDPGISDPDTDVSFLQKALETTDEQKRASQEQVYNTDDFVNRPKIDEKAITAYTEAALLEVVVKNRRTHVSLLSESGHFVIPNEFLSEAYVWEIRTVTTETGISQERVFVEPEVFVGGRLLGIAEKIKEDTELEVSLMQISGERFNLPFAFNYDEGSSIGDDVWVCLRQAGNLYPEKLKVVNQETFASGLKYFIPERDLGEGHEGLPVFNIYGEMIGIYRRGATARVLSLKSLREEAPQLIREIRR